MSDQIGRGVVSFEGDASGLKAEMNTTADAVENLGAKLEQAGTDGAAALDGISVSATEMSAQASSAVSRFLESLNRQTIATEGGKIALLEYKAAQLDATAEAQQYFDRMRAVESQTQAAAAAQQKLNDAMSQAASDNAFLTSLKTQADTFGLTKTQMLEYQAAQKGLEAEAATLISRLSAQEAQTKAAAVAQAELNATVTAAAADNAFLSALNARANALGKTTSQLLEEQAAERGLTSQAAAAIAALKAHEAATEGAGESAHGMGLQTAGARKEIAVMIHELATGNVKNFGGSLLVLGERMDVLGALFSPVALGIAAVVAVFAALGIAELKGQNQLDAYNKAMEATGGFAGVSSAQLAAMADQMSALGVPVTKSNELLLAVVATGKISGEAIQSVATASALLAAATGEDATQIVAQFAQMSADVADGAAKMSDQYHFLTLAQYDEIKALQEHGDTSGAMKVAADALTGSLEAQKQPLGTLPGILHEAALAWSSFWQAAMNAGKADTPTDMLNSLKAQLSAQKELLAGGSTSAANYQVGAQPGGTTNSVSNYQVGGSSSTNQASQYIASLQAQIKDASRDVDLHSTASQIASWFKQQEDMALNAGIAVDKLSNSLDKNYEKQQALKQLNDQYAALFNDPSDPNHQNSRLKGVTQGADGSFSGGRYGDLLSGINDKYKPKSTAAVDNASIAAQVKQAQQAISDLNDAYKNSTTVLKQQHDSGLLDDEQYYGATQDLIDQTMAAKLAQLDTEEKYLQQQKVSGAAQIKLNEQIRDIESQKAKVIADAAAAQQTTDSTQDKALANRQAALDKYNATLAEAMDTQRKAIADQVASVGTGTQDFSRQQNITRVSARFDNDNTKLAASITPSMTTDQITLINQEIVANSAARDAIVKAWQQGYSDIDAAQGDWTNGATKAFADFRVSANDVAAATASTFQDAFSGLTDALTTFVATGKLSFTSLATSVISDIARMEIRAAESQVFGYIQSLLGPSIGGASGSENFGAAASSTPDDLIGSYGAAIHDATGGLISGPGSGTSDSIDAKLSNGEYVLKASAVRAIGVGNLDQMNSGAKVSHFATGGYVGSSPTASSSSSSPGTQISMSFTAGSGGTGGQSFDKSDAAWLQKMVKNLVDMRMQQKMSGQGGYAYQMRYGQIS